MENENDIFKISHIKRAKKPFNMDGKHYHEKVEIYYLLNGERYYFIENRTYPVKKGDLVLIDKNVLHRTITTDKHAHERILLQFDTNIMNIFNKDFIKIDLYHCFKNKQRIYCLNPNEQLWVENILFNILQEYNNEKDGYLDYSKLLIIELLFFINRITKSKAPHTKTYPNQTHKKMSEIASFINANYNKDLSLNKIAIHFNYSPAYLSKVFKEVTGFSFVEYKNNIRIKEASKLLHQSKLNITEIACHVGYNNLTHFGRIFKEITGYSPTEYRKMRQTI